MKKFISIFTTLLMLSVFIVPCFAEELEVTTPPNIVEAETEADTEPAEIIAESEEDITPLETVATTTQWVYIYAKSCDNTNGANAHGWNTIGKIAVSGVTSATDLYSEFGQTYLQNADFATVVANLSDASIVYYTGADNPDGYTLADIGSWKGLVVSNGATSYASEAPASVMVLHLDGTINHDMCIVEDDCIAPTCTEDGRTVYQCSRCGETETIVVPATGHTASEVIIENEIDPTCTENGSYDEVTYCTVCNKELDRATIVVPAMGHDWGEWEIETEATCFSNGTEVRYCNNDDTHYEEQIIAIDPENHPYNHPDATIDDVELDLLFEWGSCTDGGYSQWIWYCSHCGAEVDRSEMSTWDAWGHDWDEGTITIQPTTTSTGLKTYTCLNDSSHTYTEVIPIITTPINNNNNLEDASNDIVSLSASPKTGDESPTIILALIMGLSVCVIAFCGFSYKKINN